MNKETKNIQTSGETFNKHFMGKLTVPVNICMERCVVEYTNQVGHLLSLDEEELNNISNSVEEAFCNAVKHFSGPVMIDDYIHIEFAVIDTSLVISIREKGIPFDRRKKDQYTPGSMDGINKPGMGMLLMKHGMDNVELLVHGREGKETRLTKKLKKDSLPGELIELNTIKENNLYTLEHNAIIRPAEPEELNDVMRLAWRCYGFTQEAFLYDLDNFTQKVKDGELTSIVAVDPDRNALIGHVGLKYHDLNVKVPELGLAFVDPSYRNSGLALSLGRKAIDLARENNCLGMFDCSVTTHTFSQQGMHTIGSRPCGLFMGIAAAGMHTRHLDTSNQEKGSVVNHYYGFERSQRIVYVSEQHQEMVAEIYRWLELPRYFKPGNPKPAKGRSNISVIPMPNEHNAAFIVVHAIGKDAVPEVAAALRECRRKRMDAVYSFLPLENPFSPTLVDQLEGIGFSFAGIMPHIHNCEDRLLMQFVNIPIDSGAIKVYGEMTRKLLNYILSEQERLE